VIFNGGFVKGTLIGNERPFESLLIWNNEIYKDVGGGGWLKMALLRELDNPSFDLCSLFGRKSMRLGIGK